MQKDSEELFEDTNQNWFYVMMVAFIIFAFGYKIARDSTFFDLSIFLIIVPIMVAMFFLMMIFYHFMRRHEH